VFVRQRERESDEKQRESVGTEPELDDFIKHQTTPVDLKNIFFKWLLSLYMGTEEGLPFREGLTFWDHLFVYGDNLLFLLGLAIFKKKKAEIMKLTGDDWDEYWTKRRYLENLHFQELLSDLDPNMLASEINSLRLYHRTQVLRESIIKPVPDRDVLASKYL